MKETFLPLAVAAALGLLVGFQRERSEKDLGGVRTFPLIALAGALAALLQRASGGDWILPAALLALTAFVVTGTVARTRRDGGGIGITTEVAALGTFLVGATAVLGSLPAAVVVGGAIAVLLHFKRPLHTWVRRLSEDEVRALMRIVVIGLVILPVLPNRSFGPYEVLNPFEIWLVVVLIVGISVASYVIYKLVDARAGTLLGGVLGGLISSTATTASYARRARTSAAFAAPASIALMLASTVMFGRIFVEVGAVAPRVLWDLAPPLAVMAAANLAIVGAAFWRWGASGSATADQEDPSELKAALAFGLLYGAILFAVAAAKENLGEVGLYAVAAVSGLTDVDAITLSVAKLSDAGRVEADTAWRAILLASLSNLVFKGGLAWALGGAGLVRHLAPLFGASLVVGCAILATWP